MAKWVVRPNYLYTLGFTTHLANFTSDVIIGYMGCKTWRPIIWLQYFYAETFTEINHATYLHCLSICILCMCFRTPQETSFLVGQGPHTLQKNNRAVLTKVIGFMQLLIGILLPKLFYWLRKSFEIRGWSLRIWKSFQITRSFYSKSEWSEQFLVT